MKITHYIALLAVLLLQVAATGQTTQLSERHCQFTIPAGWKVAPQQALDSINEHVRQLKLGNVRYDMMLVPDPIRGDYPYALVQFIPAPMEKATQKDIKQLVSSLTGTKVRSEVNDKLASANMSDMSMGEAQLDLTAYRYSMRAELSLLDGKRVVTMVTGIIGTQGVIQLMTSAYPDQLNAVGAVHEQLVSSFAFDPGFAYTSATAAAAEKNGSGFNWSSVAAKAGIGCAIGAVVGLVSWLKRRNAA